MNFAKNARSIVLRRYLRLTSRPSLPQLDGEVTIAALSAPVSILRDKWGAPHIYAESLHDLFVAQGFVHGQDRLWQMEFNRRLAMGTLSAEVGAPALETDRLSRTLGFHRLAWKDMERLSERTLDHLDSYLLGLNAYIEQMSAPPLECRLLGIDVQPFTIDQAVAFGRLMSWVMAHGWSAELARSKLIGQVGEELAARLGPRPLKSQPTVVPPGTYSAEQADAGLLNAAAGPFFSRGFEGGGKGSNGFVISGKKSTTGSVILNNDMHLRMTNPSIWYQIGLHAAGEERYNASGVSLPGLPYLNVGHNGFISWGATLSFADVEDLFVEKLNPANRTQYEFRGQWLDMELIEEQIAVKGGENHVETVRLTHHGPIVSGNIDTELDGEPDRATAYRSTAVDYPPPLDAFFEINTARNWSEFTAATGKMRSPSLGLVYGDIEGNIGLRITGDIPIRADGDGTVPAPGWTGDHEWIDYIPQADLPALYKPKEGFIVACNNRITGDDYPHFMGNSFMNGFRAQRLRELISGREKVSVEDCRDFQNDVYSIPGALYRTILLKLTPTHPDAVRALDLLRDWDGFLDTESVGGTIYELFLNQSAEKLLSPLLGDTGTERYRGKGPQPTLLPTNEFYGHWSSTFLRLLSSEDDWPFAGDLDRDNFLEECLVGAMAEGRSLLGRYSSRWRWGRLHKIRFGHALGASERNAALFSLGGMAIGGDSDTVVQSASPVGSYEATSHAPTVRLIYDMGNLDNCLSSYPPGASGNMASPHYGDLIDLWVAGDYFPIGWIREDIEQEMLHRLKLNPDEEE